VNVLFALLSEGQELNQLLATDPEALAALEQATVRRYPRASDQRHAFSLVRDGRDRYATRWLKGLLLAMLGGAIVGATLNGILAISFDMFGGLASIAIPLGFALGTFLGAFTAAMTGTHQARAELRPLLSQTQPGDTLVQLQTSERLPLQVLRAKLARSLLLEG
jgi:hypothetical protein